MASLQAYQSHGRRYYRIVESFRENGRPRIRVIAHLGRVEDILRLHQQERTAITVSSVSAGAVTALYHLANELDVTGRIDRSLKRTGHRTQKRAGLSVGQTLVAGMIGRACAPGSKRAFAHWAESTVLPELMGFSAAQLTSQHFWGQMHAVPIERLADIEQELVREVVGIEQLEVEALAYDTTNFYTHIATTNLRTRLPQRGHHKQGRHDLRQLGLALVVDQATQLPLAHALYEGARSDMRSFVEFLKPVRERLRQLRGHPQQLTMVFDAGASSKQNLDSLDAEQDRYVTAMRPSNYRALLAEAVDHSRSGDAGQWSGGAGLAHAAAHRRPTTRGGRGVQSATLRRPSARTPSRAGSLLERGGTNGPTKHRASSEATTSQNLRSPICALRDAL